MPVVVHNPNKYGGVTIMPQELNTEVLLGKSFNSSVDMAIGLADSLDMSGTSRWEIFQKSFTGSVERGAQVGSALGVGVTIFPDLILGHGAIEDDEVDARMLFSRKGIAGHVVAGAAGATSLLFQKGGRLLGFIAAHSDKQARDVRFGGSLDEQKLAYLEVGEARGLKFYRSTVGVGIAGALTAIKVPCVLVRSIATGAGALVGGVGGIFVAAGRSIFASPKPNRQRE